MPFSTPTVLEIDKKLREDFLRRLKDYGESPEATDPILRILFRTFAGQLEVQYKAVEGIRLALLNELMAGLGMEQRMARPAQTVVTLNLGKGSEFVAAGTELLGEAENGQKVVFATDVSTTVSPASIALAAVYQEGTLRLVQGLDMPEKFRAARPSSDPVRVNLGANPAVFVALENVPESHLSQCSFFFDLSSDAASIREALLSESWCMAGPDGQFSVEGILRPRRSNAGVQVLEWLRGGGNRGSTSTPEGVEVAMLSDGFWAGRVFVFPAVPPSRRFLCSLPKGLDSCLPKIFGPSTSQLFASERVWLRISMPREVANLHAGLISIIPHAVTASNVECLNETIDFGRHGTSIPVSGEFSTARYLVAVLSVMGAAGSVYLPESEPCADPNAGRYAIRNGCMEIRPARAPDGTSDSSVSARFWMTAGEEGNSVGPNRVTAFVRAESGVRVSNLTSAAGGLSSEGIGQAQQRFAEALLSRDRVVTSADLIVAAQAVDRRIQAVDVSSGLVRTRQGLKPVQRVKVWLDRDSFLDPAEEGRILQDELARHLQGRVLHATEVKVETAWK